MEKRLAIVLSHPTQYYSPWFRHLAMLPELQIKVFYLWDFGVKETEDVAFKTTFSWDIPLLEGYEHEFVSNRSREPGTHHFRGLDNPGAAFAIASWKPDAVLMFGYKYLTHMRLMASPLLARAPFLFRGDSHELCPSLDWKSKINRAARWFLFKRFRCFLAVGQANADYFRMSGVPEWKLQVVPHCVDNDRFQSATPEAMVEAATWKRELGIPQASTVTLFAGKFEVKKQPLNLLEAFLKITREETVRVPPCVLLFVGSGDWEEKLRESAGAEIGRTIFFASFQNQLAMPKVYAAGDLLVLPSFGRGETWGLAVNEAMNTGRPAIVSSHVGCGPDLIIPGETGWIFPAGDINALTQTLSEALSDPARLISMGKKAKNHIANFSYQRATQALCEVLASL